MKWLFKEFVLVNSAIHHRLESSLGPTPSMQDSGLRLRRVCFRLSGPSHIESVDQPSQALWSRQDGGRPLWPWKCWPAISPSIIEGDRAYFGCVSSWKSCRAREPANDDVTSTSISTGANFQQAIERHRRLFFSSRSTLHPVH